MATPRKKTAKKKKPSFGQRLDARLEKISVALEEMRVQLRNGRHDKRRARMLAHIKVMPGGAEMLKTAEDNGIEIRVLRPGAMKGSAGKLTRCSKSPSVVSIANNGDDVQMALTLWHELRHVRQMHDWGRLSPGNTGRLRDTQRMHVLSMMIEADAYTSQTLMALQAKKAGRGGYMDALLRRESRAFKTIRAFLEKTPYESFPDDGAFARALFVEVMQKGLPGYSRSYQKNYAQVFNKAASVKNFRATMAKMKTPPDFDPSDEILRAYKADGAMMKTLAEVVQRHYAEQPEKLRRTLELIDLTVERAATLPEETYVKARKVILARLPKVEDGTPEKTPREKLRDAFARAAARLNPARLWRRDKPKSQKPGPKKGAGKKGSPKP